MVPTDYRLDHVVARLIERLEGARPTWAGDPEGARQAFEEVAREQVRAAMVEFRAMALDRNPDAHADFVEREVMQTFLPRYLRLATQMNDEEERHYGLGPMGEPIGRLGLVVVALIGLFVLFRFVYLPVIWPLFLIDLSLPFWPDIAAMFYNRRYARRLEAVVTDMTRIQDQSTHYLTSAELAASEEPPRRPVPRREPERP